MSDMLLIAADVLLVTVPPLAQRIGGAARPARPGSSQGAAGSATHG